jgi:hypothetical protein
VRAASGYPPIAQNGVTTEVWQKDWGRKISDMRAEVIPSFTTSSSSSFCPHFSANDTR